MHMVAMKNCIPQYIAPYMPKKRNEHGAASSEERKIFASAFVYLNLDLSYY